MKLKDNEYWIRSGDLKSGIWIVLGDALVSTDQKLEVSLITSCSIVKDEHGFTQSGTGRIAGGIIGAALLGPIGAIGGLLSGGKKRIDETVIHCGLSDGRSFTAESTQIGAASMSRIAAHNTLSQPRINRASNSTQPEDLIECPQCAEHIKSRAKVCRFCGFAFKQAEISSTSTALNDKGAKNAELESFISDYRSTVRDSPFSDEEVFSILNRAIDICKDDPSFDTYKFLKNVAQDKNKSTKDIEKIFFNVSSIDAMHKKRAEDQKIKRSDFYLILDAIAQIRSSPYPESIVEELAKIKSRLDDLGHNEIGRSEISIVYLESGLPRTPFYIVNNCVISVDNEMRRKKTRQKRSSAIE